MIRIDYSAFFGTNIERIVFPEGLIEIGSYAFSNCKIKEIVLPNSITSIERATFSISLIEKITLPENLVYILDNAFQFCKNLKSIELPSQVKYIGYNAFEGCKNLERIFISKSVNTIYINAFKDCPKLKIYCEGEPQPNWIDHEKKTIVNDDYDETSLYSFNYHRSAGSFDSMQKTEVIHNSYNPDKNQLYTNVSREEFIKLSDNE